MEKLLNLIMNKSSNKKSNEIFSKEIIDLIEKTPNNYILGEKMRDIYLKMKQKEKNGNK